MKKQVSEFFQKESAGGLVLIAASALAILMANSPLGSLYTAFLDTPVEIRIGALEIAKPLLLWINDGLMAVFFFLIGLEIKREVMEGELATPSQIALPAFAAVGGMACPALIYVYLNWGNAEHLNGWAIPSATDIAFALGILALLGSRAPMSLKILLTAIAIIDDLGAIVIIAIFYTSNLSLAALGMGAIPLLGLLIVNRLRVPYLGVYVLLGIALWVCVLKSGVHATLAGVVAAFAVPLQPVDSSGKSLLKHVEHSLHPWIAFLILPLFAFANAGVSFSGIGIESFTEPVKLGISTGLFLGNQVGVFLMAVLCIKLSFASLPKGVTWLQLYGVSALCGIGFTMSLFIGSLAFEHSSFDVPIRLGVLTGSILSALVGYFTLRFAAPGKEP
ncbi:MAG: Na+/H+ antiporter NhaA [Hyphomicrobiales bacterium]